MRTLPLHPHIHCIYAPYYKKIKGKRKPWKKAVEETMAKFSEKEQKEIVATYDMLERRKYLIRRYVDILDGVVYNSLMKKYEKVILKRFESFDVKKPIDSFKKLWRSEEKFLTHIEKRKRFGHIEDEFDYLDKTLKCLSECEKVNIAIYKKSWNNIYFEAKISDWAVIFNEKGDLMTSYKIEENMPHFLDVHKKADKILKGVENELQQIFNEIYNSFRNNTK
jgi:hypothetical protein